MSPARSVRTVFLAALALLTVSAASAQQVRLVSVDAAGDPTFGTMPGMSSNGRFLMFVGASDNVFLLDRDTDADDIFHTIDDLRIPVAYLASLVTAGDTAVAGGVLMKLAAMRAYMRAKTVDGVIDEAIARRVGLTGAHIEDMYQIMAIANYEDRFVIPTAHRELGEDAYDLRGSCGFSFGNGCSDGRTDTGLFGTPRQKTARTSRPRRAARSSRSKHVPPAPGSTRSRSTKAIVAHTLVRAASTAAVMRRNAGAPSISGRTTLPGRGG